MNKLSLLLLAFSAAGISTKSYTMTEEQDYTAKTTRSVSQGEEQKAQKLTNLLTTHKGKKIKAFEGTDPTNQLHSFFLHVDGGEHHPAGDVISFQPNKLISMIQDEDPINHEKSYILKIESKDHPAGNVYRF